MRRVGSTPQQRGSMSADTCPDVIELDDGDFLVIGKKPTNSMPDMVKLAVLGASVGADEDIVVVPRRCVVDAAREILRNEDIN